MTTFLSIQMHHGKGILWLILIFPSDIVIFMRLPSLAPVLTAEGQSLKPWNKLKTSKIHYLHIFTFVILSYTINKHRTSLNWDGDTKVGLFIVCQ